MKMCSKDVQAEQKRVTFCQKKSRGKFQKAALQSMVVNYLGKTC